LVIIWRARHTGTQVLPTQTGAVDLVVTAAFPPAGVLMVALRVKPAGPVDQTVAALLAELLRAAAPLVGKGSNGNKFPLDVGGVDRFATVETLDEFVQLGLAGSLGKLLEEAVVEGLTGEGMADLTFLVVFVKFGEIDDSKLPSVVGFAVDLEHDFVGCAQVSAPVDSDGVPRSSKGPL
jgi:hypothetical protein